jgi:hypothetical protein
VLEESEEAGRRTALDDLAKCGLVAASWPSTVASLPENTASWQAELLHAEARYRVGDPGRYFDPSGASNTGIPPRLQRRRRVSLGTTRALKQGKRGVYGGTWISDRVIKHQLTAKCKIWCQAPGGNHL